MAWTQTDLVEAVDYYADRPVYFVEDFFGVTPTEQQGRALEALALCRRGKYIGKQGVAIRSGHGVGKTATEAWAVSWFLTTRPNPKVPCTAPTEHQLRDNLWAEISLWMSKAKARGNPLPLVWTAERVYMQGHKEHWFAVARTAGKPESLAGFHAEHLLFVVDEASGIKDPIMAVVEGALTTEGAIALLCGNPTRAQGYFADAFGRNRRRWFTITISCEGHPLVSQQWVADMIRQWGYDSDVVRVRVRGLPPKADAEQFILLEWAERAAHMKDIKPGEGGPFDVAIGVDVARYGDSETVITMRWGNYVYPQAVYRHRSVPTVAGLVLRHARELMDRTKVSRVRIKIDDTGVGGGVTDLLAEEARIDTRLEVVPVNFGGAGDDHYTNTTGVMYGRLRELLRFDDGRNIEVAHGSVDEAARQALEALGREPKDTEIKIPNDDELIGQLVARRYKVDKKGRIVLESKEEMKARNLPSPDRADSLALAFYEPPGSISSELAEALRRASLHG